MPFALNDVPLNAISLRCRNDTIPLNGLCTWPTRLTKDRVKCLHPWAHAVLFSV